MTEQWRAIDGYEGHYSVSDLGRVRSEARRVTVRGGGSQAVSERILKPCFGKRYGYPQVALALRGAKRSFDVHVLVAGAFLPPRPEGCEVRHISTDRTDCRSKNLCWGTHGDNMRDKVRHGTQPHGERSHLAKLTLADARAIVAAQGPVPAIAAAHGISESQVYRIRCGERWQHALAA